MRTISALVIAAAGLLPAAASAQNTQAQSSTDLILAIDARRTTATGTSSAGDHGSTSFQSYTYAIAGDLCGLGTGDDEPSRAPWVGWHYNADVLGSSIGAAGPELNVRITWERRWNNGARTTDGPRGTNTVTMRAGDVLVLDRVTPAGSGRCGDELRLEASVMTSASRYGGMRGAGVGRGGLATAGGIGRGGMAGGGGRGGAVAGGGAAGAAAGTGSAVAGRGGRGGAAGGGTTGATVAGSAGAGAVTAGGRGSGRGGAASATGGAVGAGSGTQATAGRGGGRGMAGDALQRDREMLAERIAQMTGRRTAEVWLIHRTPDGVEHVQQQTIQFSRSAREFSFPPVAVNTSRGVVMVDITGSLRVTDTQISIGLARRARASGAQPLDTTGSSEMSFDLPRPEEVLSFEFPALQKPAEDLLAKHKFSVRVRLR
jgi:hypothetical protein